MSEAVLAAIRLYPLKALDPVAVDEAVVLASGALEGDRRWALLDREGGFINGKRCAAIHGVRARFEADTVTLSAPERAARRFALVHDTAALEDWLAGALGQPVRLARDDAGGFPDDRAAPGPTVIGAASLDEVRGWFPGLGAEGVRRRFRANLEIAGVPPFWEDRLFATAGAVVRFRIGDVLLEGTNPCARCAVPSRDPDTGESITGFQKRFSDMRRQTLPPWAEASRFDHFYRLAVNTRVPASQAGKRVRVGDRVTVAEDVTS
jgi:uncharacterized protein YcbX